MSKLLREAKRLISKTEGFTLVESHEGKKHHEVFHGARRVLVLSHSDRGRDLDMLRSVLRRSLP